MLLKKNNSNKINIKNLNNSNQNEAYKDFNNINNKNFKPKDNLLNLEEDNDNHQEYLDSENKLEYNNIKDIIDLYNKTKKITKYSDIYRYLKSKIYNNDEAEWP